MIVNWACMKKGMRRLAILREYWKVVSKIRVRTTDKGEQTPRFRELRTSGVSALGKGIILESKRSNRDGNERVKRELDSFFYVLSGPTTCWEAPSREQYVRFSLRSLIDLALQSMQGCNVPTCTYEPERKGTQTTE